jgi:hypothetical protein
MRGIRHPLSGAVYELMPDGTIEVSKDGRAGIFDVHGRWRSGDLKQCDPHLCVWIGSKELENRFQQAASALASE